VAWLKSPAFAVQANQAVKWIVAHRQGGGGFGSTQATILALKALVEHAKANRRTANAGTLTVERAGHTLGQHSFSAGMRETIAIDGMEAALTAGDNRLDDQSQRRQTRCPTCSTSATARSSPRAVSVSRALVTKLASAKVKAGETVALAPS